MKYRWRLHGAHACCCVCTQKRSACMFAYKKHLFNRIAIWSQELNAGRNTLSEQQPRDYVGLNSAVEFIPPVHSHQGNLFYHTPQHLYPPWAPSSVMAERSWVAYTVLEVIIAVACCLGNVLVVCAVCVGIRDSLREPTFCFLVSLAVADLLVGVAAVPLAVLLDGWVSVTPDLCLLLSCVVLVLTQASVLSLLAIAVDRYLRLHTPLRWGMHSDTRG